MKSNTVSLQKELQSIPWISSLNILRKYHPSFLPVVLCARLYLKYTPYYYNRHHIIINRHHRILIAGYWISADGRSEFKCKSTFQQLMSNITSNKRWTCYKYNTNALLPANIKRLKKMIHSDLLTNCSFLITIVQALVYINNKKLETSKYSLAQKATFE